VIIPPLLGEPAQPASLRLCQDQCVSDQDVEVSVGIGVMEQGIGLGHVEAASSFQAMMTASRSTGAGYRSPPGVGCAHS